ncbi:ParA family protein [Leuconostoc mesenteroides]|uniref:ParA family protein n=1 Tax=Leuconostoc mesenteroides TaxID=1245 RepID=UPI002360A551|nr:ParA family protein [Leuconostoc mesenteroides]
MTAEVISIINMKGGVGKTTLSIGLAKYWSDNGKRVLLIDADPQFNATQAMIDADIYDKLDSTIYKLFKPQDNIRKSASPLVLDELTYEISDNLDIIPGDLNLVLANHSTDLKLLNSLKNLLKKSNAYTDYDYVIIDCPPTLTTYTTASLLASKYYVVPNRIDRYSILGIRSLEIAINEIIESEELPLKKLGIVYTMTNNNETLKTKALRERFEQEDNVRDGYLFTATLSTVNDIRVGKRGPNPMNYSKSSNDIRDIAIEIETRITEDEKNVE